MSQVDATPTETTQNPVGTQEVSEGTIKKPRPDHKCCEHCGPDAHVPHTLGCPTEKPINKDDLDKVVKEAVDDMFAVSNVWQPKEIVKFKIECPSGQRALVRHLDILDLAGAGLVEDMDSFSKKLLPNRFDDQGNPVEADEEASIWKVLEDIKKRHKFVDMTGRLMSVASVRPKIINDGVAIVKDPATDEDTLVYGYQMTVQEQIERLGKPIPPLKDGQTYAGAIGFADRMSFFVELNKPLGMIEPFRDEQATVLANLEPGEGTGVQTE